jgi:hypothetical protein
MLASLPTIPLRPREFDLAVFSPFDIEVLAFFLGGGLGASEKSDEKHARRVSFAARKQEYTIVYLFRWLEPSLQAADSPQLCVHLEHGTDDGAGTSSP